MLNRLVRKEMLDQFLGFRFLILAAMGSLTIWLSLYDGHAYYRERLKEYRRAQAVTDARIREMVDVKDRSEIYENWAEVSTIGYPVQKPPVALSIFARGIEPTLGKSGTVKPDVLRQLKRSPVAADPILGIFWSLDLCTVVQVVLGLFVLLLTCDAICGEKETGTLRLIHSFSIPVHRFLLGKFFGILVPTTVAFGLPLLLGITGILLLGDQRFSTAELARSGLILLAFSLYLTALVCAGLLASSLTHRTTTSFVLCLGFWVATVMVMPRVGLIAANRIRPAASLHELQAQKAAILNVSYAESTQERRRWRQEHPNPQNTPEGREAYSLFFSQVRRKYYDRDLPLLQQLDEAFRNRYSRRLDLAATLGRLSPAFALNEAAGRLAGTGLERHWRFTSLLEQHIERQRIWHNRTKDLDFLKVARPEKYGKYRWDASEMPVFSYREAWPGEDVQSALIDLGVLCGWGLLFFAGAYVCLLRYDPR